MSKNHDPLTPEELKEIERRRAIARAKALHLIETADPVEDARITAAAEADPDAQPLRDDAVLRPMHEVHPHLAAASLRRGRPKAEAPKRQITLRLDADVVEGFRATGAGWQTRINDALRQWLQGRAS